MKRSHPLLALLACLMISASQAQPASTVTAPVRCQSAPPVACEGSRLPTLLEYRAGEVYLQVFCQAEKESIESALDASGQPIWSLVRAVGALDTQPDALSAAIRRYRIRAGALTALRTTANPALIARLDADVLAASDASVACLDSERIGFFASAPSGADGTKCPAAHWPLWSAYQPLQLQQRWFDDPADLRDVLRHGPATAPWSYEGIAGCTPADSMVMDTKAAISVADTSSGLPTYTLTITTAHVGPTNDVPRSPKVLAMVPYGYGVRTGSTPCALVDRGAAGTDLVCAPAMIQAAQSASVTVDLVRVRADVAPPAVKVIAVGAPYATFPDADLRRRSADICTGNAEPVMGCAVASAKSAPPLTSIFPPQAWPSSTPPQPQPDNVTVNALASVVVSPLANDAPSQSLRLFSVVQPALGRVELLGDGSVRYTAPLVETDSTTTFRYVVIDAQGRLGSSTVTVRIIAPNHPPVAVPDSVAAVAGQTTRATPLANDTDPDRDPLRIVSVGTNANASVTFDGQSVSITPLDTFEGTIVLPYTISDGKLTASSTITVTVTLPRPPASLLDNVVANIVVTPSSTPVRFATVGVTLTLSATAPATVGTLQAPLDVKLWFRLRDGSQWRTAEANWWDGRMPDQAYRLVRGSSAKATGGVALPTGSSADALRLCMTTAGETAPDVACRLESATSRLSSAFALRF